MHLQRERHADIQNIYIPIYIVYACSIFILIFFNFNFLCVVVAGSLNWFSFLVALLNVPKKKDPLGAERSWQISVENQRLNYKY